jgi:hypothetical protein
MELSEREKVLNGTFELAWKLPTKKDVVNWGFL